MNNQNKPWLRVWMAQRQNRITVIGSIACFAVICIPMWFMFPEDRMEAIAIMGGAIWFLGVALIGGSYLAYRVQKWRRK